MRGLLPEQDRTGPDVAGPLDARERLNFNPLIEIDRSRLGVEDDHRMDHRARQRKCPSCRRGSPLVPRRGPRFRCGPTRQNRTPVATGSPGPIPKCISTRARACSAAAGPPADSSRASIESVLSLPKSPCATRTQATSPALSAATQLGPIAGNSESETPRLHATIDQQQIVAHERSGSFTGRGVAAR